tara:strand:+ start:69 stop:197 length:129 start_codon:yes stop_codon:yes gene_type:complete
MSFKLEEKIVRTEKYIIILPTRKKRTDAEINVKLDFVINFIF